MNQLNRADDGAIALVGHPQYTNLKTLREGLLGSLRGEVWELGPGAGINFAYYDPGIHWRGLEANPAMLPYLQHQGETYGFGTVTCEVGQAEAIPLPDASVAQVVCTHVLCSVGDPMGAIAELRRILIPGGKLILIEHIAAPTHSRQRQIQSLIRPLWCALFDGCHPDRTTGDLLEKAGFDTGDLHLCHFSVPVVGPHLVGVARKREERL